MASVNTLRAILVGGAALAAFVAALYGLWGTVMVLLTAIVVHGFLSAHLARRRPQVRPEAPPTTGFGS